MPPARKRTNAHVHDASQPDLSPAWDLSEQQQTAIDLLVTGHNLQDTADSLGVRRETVSQWRNHHAGFQAELNKRRQELWAELTAGLRALAPKAVAVLAKELDGEQALQSAIHILKACGLYGTVAPAGSTSAEEIAAEMQLAADARQHAAEEADMVIKGRRSDRLLSTLANGF